MAETADQLLAQARALEAEAVRGGEDGERGRELRARAAELRLRAIGARSYPVVVCARCFRVTGWTDAGRICDTCLQRDQAQSAYTDPHAGWVSVADARTGTAAPAAPPLKARLAAGLGLRGGLERAARREWLTLVEPDETGPISPEPGYEVEVAKRTEGTALDGSGNLIIRFSSATYRFAEASWMQLETTRIGSRALLAPAEFSAGLPIEQLAEAWGDYGAAVHAFNSRVWREQADAREGARQAQQSHADALRQQQHVSELLREDG